MPNRSAQLDRVFQSLGDPTRRAVLERLSSGPAPVTELARPFKMALPSFSQHLHVLESCRLVKSHKSGRVRTYQIAPRALKLAELWLENNARIGKAVSIDWTPTLLSSRRTKPMANSIIHQPDPNLDLLLERIVDVPPELVWRAWTTPEHIKKWFTPAPWTTVDCEIDLRPGGVFRTVMKSPEGQTFPNVGCYLEIAENERLTWTNAMSPGYRPNELPAACPGESFYFTAVISLEPHGNGTRYSALVMHADAASRKRHEDMGFRDGWSAALDQLIALTKTM